MEVLSLAEEIHILPLSTVKWIMHTTFARSMHMSLGFWHFIIDCFKNLPCACDIEHTSESQVVKVQAKMFTSMTSTGPLAEMCLKS